MITISVNKNRTLVTGHTSNECCARVSTCCQLMSMILSDYITDYEQRHGYDEIKYDLPTRGATAKHVKNIIAVFLSYFEMLSTHYPNTIQINEGDVIEWLKA